MAQADVSKANAYAALRPYAENSAVVSKMTVYVVYNTLGAAIEYYEEVYSSWVDFWPIVVEAA